MIAKIKLLWKQFLCPHHWHEILVEANPCGFYFNEGRSKDKSWLCCKCAKEGDAYAALGGL